MKQKITGMDDNASLKEIWDDQLLLKAIDNSLNGMKRFPPSTNNNGSNNNNKERKANSSTQSNGHVLTNKKPRIETNRDVLSSSSLATENNVDENMPTQVAQSMGDDTKILLLPKFPDDVELSKLLQSYFNAGFELGVYQARREQQRNNTTG